MGRQWTSVGRLIGVLYCQALSRGMHRSKRKEDAMQGFEVWIPAISAIFFSLFLPYVVQLVKRAKWSKTVNWIVAIVISLIAGIFTALVSGAPSPETFVLWVVAVVGAVQAAYNLFKAIGVTDEWLDKWFAFTSDEDAKLPTETVAPHSDAKGVDGVVRKE